MKAVFKSSLFLLKGDWHTGTFSYGLRVNTEAYMGLDNTEKCLIAVPSM